MSVSFYNFYPRYRAESVKTANSSETSSIISSAEIENYSKNDAYSKCIIKDYYKNNMSTESFNNIEKSSEIVLHKNTTYPKYIENHELPYTGIVPVVLSYFNQSTRLRNWCLILITNPWFERISILVILLNCVTLGMYQPCVDDKCMTHRCKILQIFDDIIFIFFFFEMIIKMIAMGIYGKGTYIADSWNRLDFLIIAAGILEYTLNVENINFSAIRTIRVLRPLRAINRIPSMRILVMLLLDTLPMLGNVLLLCFFVFFIFGIVGVQLWEGILRQRCFLKALPNIKYPDNLSKFFEYQGQDYICSRPGDNGMHKCSDLPPLKIGNIICNSSAVFNSNITFINSNSCVNWNQYYTECKGQGNNPFQGTISFDNIGLAWVAIFLVISLEGWTDIMYYVQDAHSFWDWIYFVLLIVVGSFFMINLCLVVIATQFSETKKREMERMRLERAKFQSTSTLASYNNNSEPASCYTGIVKYIAHLWRKGKRMLYEKYKNRKQKYQRNQECFSMNQQQTFFPNKNSSLIYLNSNYVINLENQCSEVQEFTNDHINNRSMVPTSSEAYNHNTNEHSTIQAPEVKREMLDTEINKKSPFCQTHVNRSFHSNRIEVHNKPIGLIKKDYSTLCPKHYNYCRRCNIRFSDLNRLYARTENDNSLVITAVHSSAYEHSIYFDKNVTQNYNALNRSIFYNQRKFEKPLFKCEAMTCQELLAISSAFNGALPAGQLNQNFLIKSCANFDHRRKYCYNKKKCNCNNVQMQCCSCDNHKPMQKSRRVKSKSVRVLKFLSYIKRSLSNILCAIQNKIQKFVENKYFKRSILLAILFNTLSMGIEYHSQPEELTLIVEMSNVAFSAVFALEMLLKIIAEGLFGYISNGFNVFDGVVVVLSVVELRQSFTEERGGGSSLSVLRTFRLLRILKLVRFMPNLRRQLFVMLRTMDNVAVFFSLLVLFIFIFSVLGMYLFGGKFCTWEDRSRPCTCTEVVEHHPMCHCDRKHFNNIIWALVTVFQILTQEDWNVVLFNGMQKTSHWAALYFVALMTFGNYVLFNLLVAILVEGFSSERQERREREQRRASKLFIEQSTNNIKDELELYTLHSYSMSDSDNFTKDWKSFWEKNRTSQQRNSNKFGYYGSTKSVISLGNDYNITEKREIIDKVVNEIPIIINTAATPQDSPYLTFVTDEKEPYCHTIRPINISLESIRRSDMIFIDDISQQKSYHKYDLAEAEDSSVYIDKFSCVDTSQDHHLVSSEKVTSCNSDKSNIIIQQIGKFFTYFESNSFLKDRKNHSLYIFSPTNKLRILCIWLIKWNWFDNIILSFIGLNCITLAMERPTILSDSWERLFLNITNYIFTVVFAAEMLIKVIASGMFYGSDAYYTSGWNIMDGTLVNISIVDLIMSCISSSSPRIFGILRVFRLLRSLRPLRVINRAPGLKLVVQTLMSSLRPIGNIVLICCTFFIIFGILGVQLFKGTFYYCDGPNTRNVNNKTDCLIDTRNVWVNRKYNFDDLGNALMALFVLSSRDGWVNIMYTGLDAVGVDQQPQENYSEWRLLYFISFILLVGFFVLNMFVGVVVENFHRCREEQEKEERVRRAVKRVLQIEKKRRKMHKPPYYRNYSKSRLFIHNVVTSKYFDLAIAAVIGLNVVTMALEFYMMPKALSYALKIFNYFFTAVFIVESLMKLLALGLQLYLKDKWNQLDIAIVILSVVGIVLEELESNIIPINPTIIRVMRVLRIARVLKLLKMAKGIRALLDTVMQALPQVGNLGLLFFLLFFIFAALGVELFGRLECSDKIPCQGLGEHAHFSNFGMAFLTLFRVATGDNWNGIMKDTLRDDCNNSTNCVSNCCVSTIVAPIFFVIFVLMAQFVLVNVVVAVLMKHLEESHKQIEDELDIEMQLEREMVREQELFELAEEKIASIIDEQNRINIHQIDYDNMHRSINVKMDDHSQNIKLIEAFHESLMKRDNVRYSTPVLAKVHSIPSNFIYSSSTDEKNSKLPSSIVKKSKSRSNSSVDHNILLSTRRE